MCLYVCVCVCACVSTRADIPTVVAAAGSVGAAPAPAAAPAAAAAPAMSAPASAPAGAPRPAGDRVVASPMAKTLAAEKGINLADITGTGPDGRITASDVEAYKPGGAGAKAEKKKDEGPKIGNFLSASGCVAISSPWRCECMPLRVKPCLPCVRSVCQRWSCQAEASEWRERHCQERRCVAG